MVLQQVSDSLFFFAPGLFASLVNKCILSDPKLDACCTTVEPEEFDSEGDSNETIKTEMSDMLSKASATTAAVLPIPHPIHIARHIY